MPSDALACDARGAPAPGSVAFVGAGPGAADLLTMRAARAIAGADVILHDSLVGEDVLELAAPACRLVDVGKRGGRRSVPQDCANALMLRYARAGARVVRLKGGDPSIFGRVDEERAFLESRGVETRTIPGVTAASAAAADFGFSLTARGRARRVLFLSPRAAGGGIDLPAPEALADPETTLVLYMAAHVVARLAQALRAAGRAPETPALVAQSAGRDDGASWRGDLAGLENLAARACGDGPVLIAIGAALAPATPASLGPASDPAAALRARSERAGARRTPPCRSRRARSAP